MEIDEKLIKHVATVARLTLSETEVKEFLPQLKDVLDAFSKLTEVDTIGIEPSFQPVEVKNITREDEVTPSLSQEEALKNSTQTKDGYFKGPKAV